MWRNIESTLLKITSRQVTSHEKAFGLQPTTKTEQNTTTLRNWLTFTLRHSIMLEERKAYYKKYTKDDERMFIIKFRNKIKQEAKIKELQYKFQGREENFKIIITANDAIARKKDGNYELDDVM